MEAWDWDLVSRNDFLGSEYPALQAIPAGLRLRLSHPTAGHSGEAWIPRVPRDQQVPLSKEQVGKGIETRIPALGRPHLLPTTTAWPASQVVVNADCGQPSGGEAGSRCSLDQSKSRREE